MKSNKRDVIPLRAQLPREGEFIRNMLALLPRLRRFARVLTQSSADADDLVQLTVEKCLRDASQWKHGTRLDSWMFTAMRNTWIDETRARARRGGAPAGVDAALHVVDGHVASEDMRVQAMSVEAAMASLSADQRLAVGLVLVDGMSYQEAAALMGVPEGTLTSRLTRARAILMAKLDGGLQ